MPTEIQCTPVPHPDAAFSRVGDGSWAVAVSRLGPGMSTQICFRGSVAPNDQLLLCKFQWFVACHRLGYTATASHVETRVCVCGCVFVCVAVCLCVWLCAHHGRTVGLVLARAVPADTSIETQSGVIRVAPVVDPEIPHDLVLATSPATTRAELLQWAALFRLMNLSYSCGMWNASTGLERARWSTMAEFAQSTGRGVV